jgi:hypothetical protein
MALMLKFEPCGMRNVPVLKVSPLPSRSSLRISSRLTPDHQNPLQKAPGGLTRRPKVT